MLRYKTRLKKNSTVLLLSKMHKAGERVIPNPTNKKRPENYRIIIFLKNSTNLRPQDNKAQ